MIFNLDLIGWREKKKKRRELNRAKSQRSAPGLLLLWEKYLRNIQLHMYVTKIRCALIRALILRCILLGRGTIYVHVVTRETMKAKRGPFTQFVFCAIIGERQKNIRMPNLFLA